MKKHLLPVLALVLLLSVSCGKSVESRKKAWDDALAKANAMAYEFPSFDGVIKEQIETAQVARTAVDTISGDEAKIAKLDEAIALLRAPFTLTLEEFRTLRQSTRDKITKIRGMRMEANEQSGANQAIYDAESAILRAEQKLRSTVPDRAAAEGLAGLALSDLKAIQPSLDRIGDTVKSREASTQQKVDQDKQEQEKAEKAKEPVKCEYCGSMSPPGSGKCKSCGAALSR